MMNVMTRANGNEAHRDEIAERGNAWGEEGCEVTRDRGDVDARE